MDLLSPSYKVIMANWQDVYGKFAIMRDNFERFGGLISIIVREEQCVHSIVANEKRFISEQFATYHFQMKYVFGSYISLDPTECDDNNDPMLDDDSWNERDTCVLADNDFSEQTKGAAHF